MTEHLTEPEIERYRRRNGDAAERQATAAHLAACRHCLQRVYDAEHSMLAMNSLTEALLPSSGELPFHVSSTELQEYVSGHADKADRIICESHLESCEECREQLHLLSAAQPTPKPDSRGRLTWLGTAWRNTPVRVAAGIAMVGLLIFAVVLIRRQSNPSPQVAGKDVPGTPGSFVPASSPGNVPANETTPAVPGGSGPSGVAYLKDNGREIGLDHEGRLAGMAEFDEASQRLVKNALAGEFPARPKLLDELAPIELLGEPAGADAFQVIGPVGTIIAETRPTLRWKPLNGTTSYIASVFDSKFDLVVSSPPLSQPGWSVSAPLQRGQNYFWQVTAVHAGKEIVAPVAPAPRAQFRILEADKLSALQNLKRQRPTSHLALGLTYARLGMVRDAEGEFQQLLKENPDSAIAKRLLHTVQTWR